MRQEQFFRQKQSQSLLNQGNIQMENKLWKRNLFTNLSQSLLNQGNIQIIGKIPNYMIGYQVSIPFKSGKYSNKKIEIEAKACKGFRSQSLLNQGNIQIWSIRIILLPVICYVSIPFKSGKYSNPIQNLRTEISKAIVSIPFKSGKYSNITCRELLPNFMIMSQSLLNQGNIQIDQKKASLWQSHKILSQSLLNQGNIQMWKKSQEKNI